MNQRILTSVVFVIAACGGGSGTKPAPTMGAATAVDTGAATATQPVVTEIPQASGSVVKDGALPPEIKSLPTAPPESMAAKPETARAASASADPVAPRPTGTIVGQAWYAGPPCAVASWPPQCNGAYRQAWVWIWSHGAGTWLRSAQTDIEGRYTFIVDPGWYTIMFATGFADGWWYAKVNVPPFETVTSNLVVDYGVR